MEGVIHLWQWSGLKAEGGDAISFTPYAECSVPMGRTGRMVFARLGCVRGLAREMA